MRRPLLCALLVLGGCTSQNETATSALSALRLEPIAAGDETCPAGGVRLVPSSGEARSVCNGQAATMAGVTLTPVARGDAHCPAGGTRFDVGAGSSYACNGASGGSPLLSSLPMGDVTCPAGGTRLELDGVVTFACTGVKGADGAPGAPGASGESAVTTPLPLGDPACATGGVRVTVGSNSSVVCNGARGESVVTTPLPLGDAACASGGVRLTVGGASSVVCNGAPVVTTTLPMGDASCPTGGTRFTVGGTVSVVCNGAAGSAGTVVSMTELDAGTGGCVNGGVVLTVGGQTALVCGGASASRGVDSVELTGLAPRAIALDGARFGLSTAIVEHQVVSSGGVLLVQLVPGRTTLSEAVLTVPLTTAVDFWQWRSRVLANQSPRRSVTLTFKRGAAVVAAFDLVDAWPTTIQRHGDDHGGTRAVDVTLAFAAVTRGTSSATSFPMAWSGTRATGGAFAFEALDGAESTTTVSTTLLPDGGATMLPGRTSGPRLEVSRQLTGGDELWSWYLLSRTGQAGTARTRVTLTSTTSELQLDNALPFSWSVELGSDGIARERALLAGEDLSRTR